MGSRSLSETPSNAELLARLRKSRGRLPNEFRFDRLESHERDQVFFDTNVLLHLLSSDEAKPCGLGRLRSCKGSDCEYVAILNGADIALIERYKRLGSPGSSYELHLQAVWGIYLHYSSNITGLEAVFRKIFSQNNGIK